MSVMGMRGRGEAYIGSGGDAILFGLCSCELDSVTPNFWLRAIFPRKKTLWAEAIGRHIVRKYLSLLRICSFSNVR